MAVSPFIAQKVSDLSMTCEAGLGAVPGTFAFALPLALGQLTREEEDDHTL